MSDCYGYAKTLTGNNYSALYEKTGKKEFTHTKTVSLFFTLYNNISSVIISENKIMRISAQAGSKDYDAFLQLLFANLPITIEPLH